MAFQCITVRTASKLPCDLASFIRSCVLAYRFTMNTGTTEVSDGIIIKLTHQLYHTELERDMWSTNAASFEAQLTLTSEALASTLKDAQSKSQHVIKVQEHLKRAECRATELETRIKSVIHNALLRKASMTSINEPQSEIVDSILQQLLQLGCHDGTSSPMWNRVSLTPVGGKRGHDDIEACGTGVDDDGSVSIRSVDEV